MERKRVRLRVMGLSYNPIKDGAYALMLAEVDGPYRIPVVIGASEAQSIAIVLEGVITPRPLTHDLFTSVGHAFGIKLKEVFIYDFNDGIFFSRLTFVNTDNEEVQIESRTSDAIAIAIRMNAPIFTTESLLESTGFILEKQGPGIGKATGRNAEGLHVEIEWSEDADGTLEREILGVQEDSKLPGGSVVELENEMKKAVAEENYEKAAELKQLIEKIKKENL